MKRCLMIALLGATLAGCHDATSPTSSRTMDSFGLIMARQQWRARNIHDYRFTVGYSCFCVTNHPLSVLVVHDTIYAVTDLTTGQSVPRSYGMTVDELFELIETGVKNKLPVEASFDDELWYPRSVDYNRPGWANDSGGWYSASDLRTDILLVASP